MCLRRCQVLYIEELVWTVVLALPGFSFVGSGTVTVTRTQGCEGVLPSDPDLPQ